MPIYSKCDVIKRFEECMGGTHMNPNEKRRKKKRTTTTITITMRAAEKIASVDG